jgi:hypothetical protein
VSVRDSVTESVGQRVWLRWGDGEDWGLTHSLSHSVDEEQAMVFRLPLAVYSEAKVS